jgi:excisionase family DNA binding protein
VASTLEEQQKLLKVPEVAERLRLSVWSVYRLIEGGRLPALRIAATTLAQIIGHSDSGFTLRVYARDGRDEAAVISDVLSRAAGADVGS